MEEYSVGFFGAPGVGKTSLINNMLNEPRVQIEKLGEMFSVDTNYGEMKVRVRKVGEEMPDTVFDCCVIVFDLSNIDSYNEIEQIYQRICGFYEWEIPEIIICGNKSDLSPTLPLHVTRFKRDHGLFYHETSCETGAGIYGLIVELLREMSRAPMLRIQ